MCVEVGEGGGGAAVVVHIVCLRRWWNSAAVRAEEFCATLCALMLKLTFQIECALLGWSLFDNTAYIRHPLTSSQPSVTAQQSCSSIQTTHLKNHVFFQSKCVNADPRKITIQNGIGV